VTGLLNGQQASNINFTCPKNFDKFKIFSIKLNASTMLSWCLPSEGKQLPATNSSLMNLEELEVIERKQN
jgi:hypothetical protein